MTYCGGCGCVSKQVVPEKKKSKGPPKVAAAQAVEPSEEDEFEQLGRGVTYTDVWRLSTSDYSWARVPTTGEVGTPPCLRASTHLHTSTTPRWKGSGSSSCSTRLPLSAMRTNQKAEEKSAAQERREHVS
jgi:hypothetical protein